MKYLIEAIQEIAEANPFGFTIKLPSLEFITDGYSVAFEETQNSFDVDGLVKVINHAKQNGNVIGGWLDEETNLYYFDSCMILTDESEAIEFAKQNKQIAIFDLTNLKVIRV